MSVFEARSFRDHEQVVFGHDTETGMRAIIAIHSTALGPALGGTRLKQYGSEDAAIQDALRLSSGMTLKNAAAGLDHGGGKAVVICDPDNKTDDLMRSYGAMVDTLCGNYITAEDVGTTTADMAVVRHETKYVVGLADQGGDPSPVTAWGVYRSMLAVAKRLWGVPSLDGRHVVVSGVGKVGSALVPNLVEAGARVTIGDVRRDAIERVRAEHAVDVAPIEIIDRVECDVYAPCALGGVLSAMTIPELNTAAVCGSANNQLATDDDAQRLADRNVLYAPDFIVNAGGVINVAEEWAGYDRDRAMAKATALFDRIGDVFDRADADGINPAEAARRVAMERITGLRRESPDRAR